MTNSQLPSADAAWLHMDSPGNPMVVNAVIWFDVDQHVHRLALPAPRDRAALEELLRMVCRTRTSRTTEEFRVR